MNKLICKKKLVFEHFRSPNQKFKSDKESYRIDEKNNDKQIVSGNLLSQKIINPNTTNL